MNAMLESVERENCGNVLKNIRKKFGSMSLQDLAKIIGVSRSTIMRIEDGKTLPSDEFLNRLKALQVIGVSKFRALSKKDKTHFTELIEETGEDPEIVSKAISKNMLKKLTPAGIIAGLGTVGGAALVAPAATVSSISIAAGFAGFGIVKGLQAILKANDLKATKVDGRWEIIRKQ